jgi:hypothetical protein
MADIIRLGPKGDDYDPAAWACHPSHLNHCEPALVRACLFDGERILDDFSGTATEAALHIHDMNGMDARGILFLMLESVSMLSTLDVCTVTFDMPSGLHWVLTGMNGWHLQHSTRAALLDRVRAMDPDVRLGSVTDYECDRTGDEPLTYGEAMRLAASVLTGGLFYDHDSPFFADRGGVYSQ